MSFKEKSKSFAMEWGSILIVFGLLLMDRITVFPLSPLAVLVLFLMGLRGLYKIPRERVKKIWLRLPLFTTGIYVVFLVLDYLSYFLFSHWWGELWFLLFFAFALLSNILVWLLIGLNRIFNTLK